VGKRPADRDGSPQERLRWEEGEVEEEAVLMTVVEEEALMMMMMMVVVEDENPRPLPGYYSGQAR